MAIRFLHTADLQIGKNFGQFPPDTAAALRAARIGTLKRIGLLANERGVDAVLVAGDCFDNSAVADETLGRFKIALEAFAGKWILLPGNHDPAIAESPWSRLKRLSLPENVVIADKPLPIVIGDKAAILPAPKLRRRDATDLTAWFDRAETADGLIRIGLAHGSVRERLPEAAREAPNPVALDRAEHANLDYLALGDWHGLLKITERAWYSGTPEPDRFPANEPGYVLCVMIDRPGATPSVEHIPIAAYRWVQHSVEVRPGGAGEIRHAVSGAETDFSRLVVHFDLSGTIDLTTHASIAEVLGDLRARVFYMESVETNLIVEPAQDDLDSIDTRGFVRDAMERLRGELEGPRSEAARRALSLLYGLHHSDHG